MSNISIIIFHLLQGYLLKRSSSSINKEWKKKYVTLLEGGILVYYPNLHVSALAASARTYIIISLNSQSGHSRRHSCNWTALLIYGRPDKTLFKPQLIQTLYLHIPASGQLHLRTLFLLPEGVRLWELQLYYYNLYVLVLLPLLPHPNLKYEPLRSYNKTSDIMHLPSCHGFN